MEKKWYESKTVWGIIGFTVFGLLNQFWPNEAFLALITLFLGWAGYGIRDSLM